MERSARTTGGSYTHSEPGQGALVLHRTAGAPALLSAVCCRRCPPWAGDAGFDGCSLLQREHQERKSLGPQQKSATACRKRAGRGSSRGADWIQSLGSARAGFGRRRACGSRRAVLQQARHGHASLAGIKASSLLDHDLVLDGGGHLDRSRHVLSRTWLVVGMAL